MSQRPMNPARRILCGRGLFAVFLTAGMMAPLAASAQADAWPSRPIQVIVPAAPGGVHDLVIRALQPRLAKELGQQIIIVNKPGADFAIGTVMAKRSPNDGYTWVMASIPTTANPLLKNAGYDPIADFTAVAQIGGTPGVLVVPAALGVKTLADFVKLARAKPGELARKFHQHRVGSLVAEPVVIGI